MRRKNNISGQSYWAGTVSHFEGQPTSSFRVGLNGPCTGVSRKAVTSQGWGALQGIPRSRFPLPFGATKKTRSNTVKYFLHFQSMTNKRDFRVVKNLFGQLQRSSACLAGDVVRDADIRRSGVLDQFRAAWFSRLKLSDLVACVFPVHDRAAPSVPPIGSRVRISLARQLGRQSQAFDRGRHSLLRKRRRSEPRYRLRALTCELDTLPAVPSRKVRAMTPLLVCPWQLTDRCLCLFCNDAACYQASAGPRPLTGGPAHCR